MASPPAVLPLSLSHREFVTAFHNASIIVNFDPKGAARVLSAQLLLPLFMMPVLGLGVALALVGWVWAGLLVIALGIVVPRLIKRSAPRFLIQQALEDETVYQNLLRTNVMQVVSREPA
ncbi:MAG: hypothetical protein EHM16_05355 [Betaproteobacteria bacterium]|nr:MAG: hypothetical protein EHM16_05355 [Betaproteobacteria bacterium]